MEHHLAYLLAWGDGVVLLAPLPLIVVANWHDRASAAESRPVQVADALGSAAWVFLALVPAGCLLWAIAESGLRPRLSAALVITSGFAGALIAEPPRAWLARLLPIDPTSAVHATALVLSVALVGIQIGAQLSVDVLAQQASTGVALEPADLIIQKLPFLFAAALGVGLFTRRSLGAALDRLGLVRPTAWQIVVGLAAAGLFYTFGNGVDMLTHAMTPGLAHKVEAANQRLFGHLVDPLGIATIALAAGICEEALFRGALQPRLGILWTSLVFAAVHTQYGLSLDFAAVFVLAIGLGLLRKFTNTTTSTTCHVVYNTLVGVGVGGMLLGPALAIEAALLVGAFGAFFTGRLGNLRTAP